MSQQPFNLRRSAQIVRWHKILVSVVTGVGLIAGVGYAVVKGPTYTSQALVVIPVLESSAATSTSTSTSSTDIMGTQVVVATSVPVLQAASSSITPAVSFTALQSRVAASSPASGVVAISAKGKSAAQAESEANQVAAAYVAYIGAPKNPVGQLSAHVFQQATTAAGTSAASAYGMYGGGGLVLGFVLGAIAAIVISRRDRKLRTLGDIASALGVPVVAALPAEHPTDAAGWTKLLDSYDPPAVHAWRLWQVLQKIGVGATAEHDRSAGPASVAIVSPATDPDALALGVQLASYAASLGIPTVLVMGPQQDSNSTAALRTACAGWSGGSGRAARLRAIAADGGRFAVPSGARLVVLVLAVDTRQQEIPQTMPTVSTLVGVSAGGATAEQLAQIATAAAADGRDIVGIMVADPDLSDQAPGRLASPGRPARRGPQAAPVYNGWDPHREQAVT